MCDQNHNKKLELNSPHSSPQPNLENRLYHLDAVLLLASQNTTSQTGTWPDLDLGNNDNREYSILFQKQCPFSKGSWTPGRRGHVNKYMYLSKFKPRLKIVSYSKLNLTHENRLVLGIICHRKYLNVRM